MKVVAIIQARTGSKRLPKKVLKKLGKNSILEWVVKRLELAKSIGEIAIATTVKKSDDKIALVSKKLGIRCFRGSESNVLSRYCGAAKKFKANAIVRITSDCPLLDPETVEKAIRVHLKSKADYTTNIFERNFPRGLDVEVVSAKALFEMEKCAKQPEELEHVTLYIRNHPEKFSIKKFFVKKSLQKPDYRITIDTIEDFCLLEKIFSAMKKGPAELKTADVLKFLDENPEIAAINSKIVHTHRWVGE